MKTLKITVNGKTVYAKAFANAEADEAWLAGLRGWADSKKNRSGIRFDEITKMGDFEINGRGRGAVYDMYMDGPRFGYTEYYPNELDFGYDPDYSITIWIE